MKNLWHRLCVWHWAHKGETMAHLTYLGATFVEGHGLHAGAAGLVIVFIVAGLVAGEH